VECLKAAAQRVMGSDSVYRIKRAFIFKVYFSAPVDTCQSGEGERRRESVELSVCCVQLLFLGVALC